MPTVLLGVPQQRDAEGHRAPVAQAGRQERPRSTPRHARVAQQPAAEQPHVGGPRTQLVGDAVLVLDPLLERDDDLPDELPDGVPGLAEVLGVHAAVVPRAPPDRRDGSPRHA